MLYNELKNKIYTQKLALQVSFPSIIKIMYLYSAAKITLNAEILKSVSLKS